MAVKKVESKEEPVEKTPERTPEKQPEKRAKTVLIESALLVGGVFTTHLTRDAKTLDLIAQLYEGGEIVGWDATLGLTLPKSASMAPIGEVWLFGQMVRSDLLILSFDRVKYVDEAGELVSYVIGWPRYDSKWGRRSPVAERHADEPPKKYALADVMAVIDALRFDMTG